MTLKAIETVFRGFRFRSRLEARWAVFFSELRVGFQYEVEGFDLPSGRYLPDFFIPSERTYIEIKPGPMPKNYLQRIESRLAWELMRESNRSVYILWGDPVDALAPGYPGMSGFHSPDDEDGLSFLYLNDYEPAALRARQARFEFGETPA